MARWSVPLVCHPMMGGGGLEGGWRAGRPCEVQHKQRCLGGLMAGGFGALADPGPADVQGGGPGMRLTECDRI